MKTGDVFEGRWIEDKKEGPGKFTSTKLGYNIRAVWKNDEIENINSDSNLYDIFDDVNEG